MGGWVVIVVIILIAAVSAISQMIKSQQEQAPKRERPGANRGGVKTPTGDIDRFLQELDKLRQKAADGGVSKPAAKAPPPPPRAKRVVEKPQPKRQRVEPPPPPPAPAKKRVEPIPVATVLPPSTAVGAATAEKATRSFQFETAAGAPKVTGGGQQTPVTPFGQALLGLLTSPQAVPMAVVLQEVLGPPKGKR